MAGRTNEPNGDIDPYWMNTFVSKGGQPRQLPGSLQHPAAKSGLDDGGTAPYSMFQKGSEIDTEGSVL